MPRPYRPEPDDADDDEIDDDADDGYDADDDDAETVPCPHCLADVYEGAEQCPRCGAYLSEEDRPPRPRSNFVAILMVLALVAALIWVFGG